MLLIDIWIGWKWHVVSLGVHHVFLDHRLLLDLNFFLLLIWQVNHMHLRVGLDHAGWKFNLWQSLWRYLRHLCPAVCHFIILLILNYHWILLLQVTHRLRFHFKLWGVVLLHLLLLFECDVVVVVVVAVFWVLHQSILTVLLIEVFLSETSWARVV